MAKRKAPTGCFWRGAVLWGRIQAGGEDIKWSLRTDDPKTAASRRKAERDRVIAAQRYGDQRRTFAEAMEAWGRFIADKISGKTLKRYTSSLSVLQPFLEGMYLDEIDKRLIGSIVETRRDTPYVPKGKKHPIKVTIATIKRDLTALSSVFDFCVDEEWMPTNPAMEWLKPGHRKKSRLQERRDPIVLPDPAHIQMVIDQAPGQVAAMIGAALKTGARLDELKSARRNYFDRGHRQLTVIGKRNKLRVIDLEDAGEDFGFEILSHLPITLETKALFWHRREVKKRPKLGQQPFYLRFAATLRPYQRQDDRNVPRLFDAGREAKSDVRNGSSRNKNRIKASGQEQSKLRETPVNRAQLEQDRQHGERFCKPKVGSSILSTGTNKIKNFSDL